MCYYADTRRSAQSHHASCTKRLYQQTLSSMTDFGRMFPMKVGELLLTRVCVDHVSQRRTLFDGS